MPKLMETFRAFSGILVICPCCGDLVRLSDLKLRYTGRFERTVLDGIARRGRILDAQEERVSRREERFEERENALRETAARRGRKRVGRIIRRIDPSMSRLAYDPQDIKNISHPVDLIVFDGLHRGDRIRSIVFVARSRAPGVRRIRRSIDGCLTRGRYLWETVRVDSEGALTVETG